MKKITVIVDEDGNLDADFSGFKNNECVGEEEKFRHILEKYGIIVKNSKTIPKTLSEHNTNTNKISTKIF